MGTIKVKGYVEKEVAADLAEYVISFRGRDIKTSVSVNDARRQSEIFLKEMKDAGFDISQMHLDDDNIDDYRYDDRSTKSTNRKKSFKVKFDPKISNLILSIIERNNLNVSIQTRFDISDKKSLHEELLKEAVKESKNRAELIASVNGQTVKYIDSVEDDIYEEEEKIDVFGMKLLESCVPGADAYISDDLQGKLITQSATVYIKWVIE